EHLTLNSTRNRVLNRFRVQKSRKQRGREKCVTHCSCTPFLERGIPVPDQQIGADTLLDFSILPQSFQNERDHRIRRARMNKSKVYGAQLIVLPQKCDVLVSPPHTFFEVSLGFV